MFFRSVIVLALMSLVAGFTLSKDDSELLTRGRRSAIYHGPSAPLNHDGTVALTPEVHHAKAAHSAAIAMEFQRLHEAESLAAAHPDYTSPSHDYSSYHGGQYNHGLESSSSSHNYSSIYGGQYQHDQYNSDIFSHGGTYKYNPEAHIPAPLNHDGTVALTPEVQHAKAAHNAAIAKEFQRLHEAESLAAAHPDYTSPSHDYSSYHGAQYNHGQESSSHYGQATSYKYNPEAHIPAPLNHDGTVAQTGAYKAIAASHHAEYANALHRLKHQDPHFQHQAALGYGWH